MPVLEVKVSGKKETLRRRTSGNRKLQNSLFVFLIISCDITLGNSGELAASLKIS